MKKLSIYIAVILLSACSPHIAPANPVTYRSVVFFHAENEDQIFNYNVQILDNGFKDVATIKAKGGGDYYDTINYVPGQYRLKIIGAVNDSTGVFNLK